MKKVWLIHHYGSPPEYRKSRHSEFMKHLKNDYDFEVFCSSKIHNTDFNIKEKGKIFKVIYSDGVKYNMIKNIGYNSNSIARILNMIGFSLKILLIPFINKEKPDIVYLSSPSLLSSFTGLLIGKLKRAKIIIEIRDIWPYSIVDYIEKITTKNIIIKILSKIEKIIYQYSNAIIFTMPGGEEYIKDRGWKNIQLEKVFYINNGIDLKEFRESIHYIDDEDLNSNLKKFIYAGSIRPANDVYTLVRAFSKLETSAILLIYGKGSELFKIEKYIQENKIKNIKYKGFVKKEDIPSILAYADFNILTYLPMEKSLVRKYGSSQNKLFEYLASSKLVISNEIYGEKDIISSNKCGLAKKCLKEEDYIDLIKEALNLDSEKSNLLIENSKKLIEQYDYSNLSNKLKEVFSFVLNMEMKR